MTKLPKPPKFPQAAPLLSDLDLKSDSLSYSLIGASQAISLVLNGLALPQALSKIFTSSNVAPANRGAIQDLSYRTMRQVGRVDALISAMTTKAPEPALLYSLLCCCLALIVEEDKSVHPYAEFTVVDQAVNAAAAHPDIAHAKNMVNALLRRFLRERKELLDTVMKLPPARWNYPQWWIDSCKTAYPNDWQAILTAGNLTPPLTLRINQHKTSMSTYLSLLQENGMPAKSIGDFAVRLEQALPVQQIPGFMDGLVSVQDAAAQLAAPLLDLQDGMRVLDACAAPGGKTGHLLETANINLLALDSDPKRVTRITENLDRLQLKAKLIVGDATKTDWWDGQQFDRVIADLPCTASGIVRRHPDIRWLRRKVDSAQLATLSARILDNLWMMTKPNGKLLLVTCSVWPQESEAQAAAFAHRHQAKRLTAPGQMLPTATADSDHDGLFYALFQKE
ncbi:16S rRNA (cytosine(967)-C(5))-methyltransferase RsmB [Solimicrobium silvestre]|uniref:RsmB: ribosomal RNA small subunit methyltransferase B n=1 Tax=Solimicrobium silvestre TaxID=2099400 RepID=A0A2S9H000_9BURK|nr:16S rRNA (cytosine(967)-C(5))-methyltransferase RsmB [Solimicrobium silvestre]PRC93315.1 rsmB: ribosomal RNA small subunit methyltransferase B [Solimicrobium silvestre]